MKVKNPKNGQTITAIPVDSEASIAKKVATLSKAGQAQLKQLSISARKDAMLKFASLLDQRKDELAKTLSNEMGKPVQQVRFI
jgi:acyl-CoA reductase-like NAD-dependent aldehyde dehydrogenase